MSINVATSLVFTDLRARRLFGASAAAGLVLGLASSPASPAPLAQSGPPGAPTATLVGVPDQVLIGEPFDFAVRFEPDADGGFGYGPFIDVMVDHRGADGDAASLPCDGLTIDIQSITIAAAGGSCDGGGCVCTLGEQVDGECPNDGTSSPALPVAVGPGVFQVGPSCPGPVTSHPWGLDFQPLPSFGQLVTIALPFGSVAANQPPMVVRLRATAHQFADINVPLEITARAGYRYSSKAEGSPPQPSPATVPWTTRSVTPVVMTLDKGYSGPEIEVATGPNFPYFMRYPIAANVADGQTVTNLRLRDYFSSKAMFDGSASTNGSWQPLGRDVLADFGNWTSPPEPWLDVGFYVPQTWSGDEGQRFPVLNPATCADETVSNTARVFGEWTPVDPRDGPAAMQLMAEAMKDINAQCVAIQKTMQLWLDNGAPGLSPGDYIRYRLVFQFTDYHAFGDIVISDELSDGQEYWDSWPVAAPQLRVTDRTGTKVQLPSKNFPPKAPVVVTEDPSVMSCGLAGGTRIEFPVSEAMKWLPPTVPPSESLNNGIVTGGYALAPSSPVPASGEIVFYDRVRETVLFPEAEPGDENVVKHDPIGNCVYLHAERYNVNQPAPSGPATYTPAGIMATDKSGASASIVPDTVAKSVYARNGVPGAWSVGASGLPHFAAGDTITYRITKVIPTGDVENLTIEDWFPLPVTPLPSAGVAFMKAVCGVPAVGVACLGPSDSLTAGVAPPPTFSSDPAHNTVKWDYGNFHNDPSDEVVIDLLVSLRVSDAPFADGLHLTNLVQECEANTQGTLYCQVALAQFELTEPRLKIWKGVVATDNADSTFSPTAFPPVPFGSSSCPKFAPSTITSGGQIDYDLNGADAGDRVTFAIVVENLGSGLYGALDVKLRDVLPSGMTHVNGSLCVYDGAGVEMTTNPTWPHTNQTAAFNALFGSGLELVDPGTTATPPGALDPPGVPGKNLVVLTFDVMLADTIPVGCHTNEAELVHYATSEGGPDFVAAGFTAPFSDTAKVCIGPTITKEIVTTSEPHTTPDSTSGGQPTLAIGEIVKYRIAIDVPEGTSPNFTIKDQLPADLVPLPATINTTIDAPITAQHNPPQLAPATWSCGSGNLPPPLELSFGDVSNLPNNSAPERITVEFNALVCNSSGNSEKEEEDDPRTKKVNVAQVWTFDTAAAKDTLRGESKAVAHIVEPQLTIEKRVVTDPLDLSSGSGQTITYEIVVKNVGSAAAFDSVITDLSPLCLDGPVPVTAVCDGLTTGATQVSTPGQVEVNVHSMLPKGTVTVTYGLRLKPDCRNCEMLVNTATVTWTSLPGVGTPVGPNNGTGSSTPGGQGAPNGERDGSGSDNDYRATSRPVSPCGWICGQKYYDRNGNGSNDGEPGLDGWLVEATAGGAVAGQASTSPFQPLGLYCMSVLPGTYAVNEVMTQAQHAAGWQQTAPAVPWSVTVGVGQTVEGIDFGNNRKDGCQVEICGIKFADTNGNGVQDDGEKGIAGWEIEIQGPHGVTQVVKTEVDGTYCVTLTGQGGYQVFERDVSGYTQTYPVYVDDGRPAPYVIEFFCDPMPRVLVLIPTRGEVPPDQVNFGNKPDKPFECEALLKGQPVDPAPVLAWGSNADGQVNGGPPGIPTGKIWPQTYAAVAAGSRHSLAIESQSGRIAQWGHPLAGTPPGGTMKAVAAGGLHSLAIDVTGDLWAWGYNWPFGTAPVIPCDTDTGKVPPCKEQGPWKLIAAGSDFSLATDAGDAIRCWGEPYVCNSTPAGQFVEIAAGSYHALARRADGTVACWPATADGCAGMPAMKFRSIGAGVFHSVGIVDAGSGATAGPLLQWGWLVGMPAPPAGNFVVVDGGYELSVALSADGTLYRWGKNSSTNRVLTRVEPTGRRFTAISASGAGGGEISPSSHVLALMCLDTVPPITPVPPAGCPPYCTVMLPGMLNAAEFGSVPVTPLPQTTSPTPFVTISATPAPSRTSTPSVTISATPTPSRTPIAGVTISATPTPSRTSTPGVTISATPSHTPTLTPLPPTPTCVQPPTGMQAWWKLDELTGAANQDLAGANNQGAPLNAGGAPLPASVPARVGTGLSFAPSVAPTGPRSYVEVANHPEVNFGTGDFSIDAWVRLGQIPAGGIYPIVEKMDLNQGYSLFVQDGQLLLRFGPDNFGGLVAASSTATTPMIPGPWYHVTTTVRRVNPSPSVTFYVNGVQVGSGPPAGPGMAATNNVDSTVPLWIGGNSRQAGGGATVTLNEITIDELEFFDRELSQQEILGLVNAGGAGKCQPPPTSSCLPLANLPGLAAWWRLDEGSGETALDAIANPVPNHGQIAGLPATWGPGRVGQALSFNGTSTYVEVPHHASLDFGASPGGDFTLDAWVRLPAAANTTMVKVLLNKQADPGGPGYQLYLWNAQPGLQLADAGGFTNFGSGVAVPKDDQWHLVVVTVDRDATNGIRFYLDGAPIGNPHDPTVRPGSLANSAPLRIGSLSFEGGSLFHGWLDEAEVLRSALSAGQVASLHQADAAGKCAPTPTPTINTHTYALVP